MEGKCEEEREIEIERENEKKNKETWARQTKATEQANGEHRDHSGRRAELKTESLDYISKYEITSRFGWHLYIETNSLKAVKHRLVLLAFEIHTTIPISFVGIAARARATNATNGYQRKHPIPFLLVLPVRRMRNFLSACWSSSN